MALFSNRVQLHIALRVIRRKHADHKADIDAALGNSDLMAALQGALEEAKAELSGGPVMDFLDWLLAHADDILSLILKLLPLFTN